MDLIDREQTIQAIDDYTKGKPLYEYPWQIVEVIKSIPSAQPELLTVEEQRIFLAAMGREEKICRKFDDRCGDCKELYEVSLAKICHEITRKVKSALWT